MNQRKKTGKQYGIFQQPPPQPPPPQPPPPPPQPALMVAIAAAPAKIKIPPSVVAVVFLGFWPFSTSDDGGRVERFFWQRKHKNISAVAIQKQDISTTS